VAVQKLAMRASRIAFPIRPPVPLPWLSALEQLITQVALRWKEPDAPILLRGKARAVDAALLQV
jgi:hypothetical protein